MEVQQTKPTNDKPVRTPAKVSVIIPVYNTAPYLRACLDSICRQTLKELQILVVNDGSTDQSQEIIEEYAAQDGRIEWIRQENAGQGAARNRALERANGEFVYFMDSDDLLELHCLQQCYELCQAEELDYVTFDADAFRDNGMPDTSFNYDRRGLIDDQQIWEKSCHLLLHTLKNDSFRASVCLFLIRHSAIGGLRFPEGIIHEDNFFVFGVMESALRCRYLPEQFFHRRVRSQSTMTSRFSLRNMEGYVTVAALLKQMPSEEAIELFLHKTLNSVIWLAHQLTWREKWATLRLFRQHRLCRYATWKSWMVFWLKRK